MKRILWACLFLALPAGAQDFSRQAQPGNGFSYVLGKAQEHWQGGQVDWYYNPANQPAALSTDEVVNLFKTAAAKWEGMCKLKFNYRGLTSAAPNLNATWDTKDGVNVFGWEQLTGTRSIYAGYTVWWYDATGLMVDADMVLNTVNTWTQNNKTSLEALITHELGHVLGLNHSDINASVMFANPYHSYTYQRTLRGDDAQACAALYGASPNAESNRVFNWAEQTYGQFFAPAVAPSASYGIYYYRYYPTTNSYLGSYLDSVSNSARTVYLGPDGKLLDVGLLSGYTAQAYTAGF